MMLMLPFATNTNLHDAMRNSNGENELVQVILKTLRAKHNAPGALRPLKTLWLKYSTTTRTSG